MGVPAGCCFWRVTARAGVICQEGHPAQARTHRVPPAQAQRQALQAALTVSQPAPAQLGQHGEGTAVTRLETQAPRQSLSAPGPPRPPRSARPKPGWSPGGLGSPTVRQSRPCGEGLGPHLGQHVAAVPVHRVLLFVERGDVGAAQHRAGPWTRRLPAGPPASGAGAESRGAPHACWAPGMAPTQTAGRPRARPGLPASPHRLEPPAPARTAAGFCPGPQVGADPRRPATAPRVGQGSRGQGPGLPVGAVCGVAGPWSVGGPTVHAGAPGHGDAARVADVIQNHPCRGRQAVWQVRTMR